MSRTVLALLLALMLSLPLAPGALAGTHDDGDAPGPRTPTADERQRDRPGGEEGEDEAEDDGARPDRAGREERPGRPDGRGPPIGSFEVSPLTREVEGDYVSFRYDDGGLQNFTAGGTPLFDALVHDAEADRRERGASAHGAQIRVEMPTFRAQVHDNPGAVTRFQTDGLVSFTFADTVALERVGEDRVRFRSGDVSGTVRADGLALDGRNVTGQEGALLFLDTPRGAFDKHREDIGRAIAARHVGAELTVQQREGGVETDSVSYENVTLTTLRAEQGNLTVLIDGHGFDGRVLVLNVDGRLVGADSAEKLRVLFDNASIQQASNLTDVLDPDDDGLQAEYYPVFDPQTQTFQLLVSVPHYSVHTLTIGSLVVPLQPSIVLGLLAGTALLVPSALVLFRRR